MRFALLLTILILVIILAATVEGKKKPSKKPAKAKPSKAKPKPSKGKPSKAKPAKAKPKPSKGKPSKLSKQQKANIKTFNRLKKDTEAMTKVIEAAEKLAEVSDRHVVGTNAIVVVDAHYTG